jgi:3',5'-cyclic-nucleotide phosphodiesterase
LCSLTVFQPKSCAIARRALLVGCEGFALKARRGLFLLLLCPFLCYAASDPAIAALAAEPRFVAIALGTAGGLTEANLTSFLLAPSGSGDFVALDAGTLLTGLEYADRKQSFSTIVVPPESSLTLAGYILTERIKAYLLSHPHLDHVAGLVHNSPEDSKKAILGLPATIDALRDHLFNGKLWPNFADEGPGLQLKKYHFVRLQPGEEQPIVGTQLTVRAFELCHAGGPSTAFLLRADNVYALYLGDTGPDEAEHCDKLQQLWQAIAPLVQQGKLRGLFIEISYPDPRESNRLYGHLTPRWLMIELQRLASLMSAECASEAMRRLTVIVTHIKPTLQRGPSAREQIMQQVNELNPLGVRFVFPEQGERVEF